jgi:hypothetical protein
MFPRTTPEMLALLWLIDQYIGRMQYMAKAHSPALVDPNGTTPTVDDPNHIVFQLCPQSSVLGLDNRNPLGQQINYPLLA